MIVDCARKGGHELKNAERALLLSMSATLGPSEPVPSGPLSMLAEPVGHRAKIDAAPREERLGRLVSLERHLHVPRLAKERFACPLPARTARPARASMKLSKSPRFLNCTQS